MRLISIHIFLFAVLFSSCASNAKIGLKTEPLAESNTDLSTPNLLPLTEKQLNSSAEKYFVSQEYKLTISPNLQTPSEWEKQQFKIQSKAGFSVKSKNQVPRLEENTYYRFSFIYEAYETVEEAKSRVTRLREPPPANSISEPDKAFPLREGFSLGNKVYIITTDVYAFMPELERLTKELQKQLQKESSTKL